MFVEVYTKKHGNLGPFVIHDIWTIFSFFSIFSHPVLYHLPGCSLWKGLNNDYKWVPLKCCWMTKQIIIFNLSQFSLTYWTIKGFTSRVLIWSFNGAYWILLITCISVPLLLGGKLMWSSMFRFIQKHHIPIIIMLHQEEEKKIFRKCWIIILGIYINEHQ